MGKLTKQQEVPGDCKIQVRLSNNKAKLQQATKSAIAAQMRAQDSLNANAERQDNFCQLVDKIMMGAFLAFRCAAMSLEPSPLEYPTPPAHHAAVLTVE